MRDALSSSHVALKIKLHHVAYDFLSYNNYCSSVLIYLMEVYSSSCVKWHIWMYHIYSYNIGIYTFRQDISGKMCSLYMYLEGETGCTSEEDSEDINFVYMVSFM